MSALYSFIFLLFAVPAYPQAECKNECLFGFCSLETNGDLSCSCESGFPLCLPAEIDQKATLRLIQTEIQMKRLDNFITELSKKSVSPNWHNHVIKSIREVNKCFKQKSPNIQKYMLAVMYYKQSTNLLAEEAKAYLMTQQEEWIKESEKNRK